MLSFERKKKLLPHSTQSSRSTKTNAPPCRQATATGLSASPLTTSRPSFICDRPVRYVCQHRRQSPTRRYLLSVGYCWAAGSKKKKKNAEDASLLAEPDWRRSAAQRRSFSSHRYVIAVVDLKAGTSRLVASPPSRRPPLENVPWHPLSTDTTFELAAGSLAIFNEEQVSEVSSDENRQAMKRQRRASKKDSPGKKNNKSEDSRQRSIDRETETVPLPVLRVNSWRGKTRLASVFREFGGSSRWCKNGA